MTETPRRLSDPQSTGFLFHPVVVGHDLYVSGKRDFMRLDRDGKLVKLGLVLPETPEQVVSDDLGIYITLFKRDEVLSIPLEGGSPRTRYTTLMKLRRGVLAISNGTLFAVSYATGELVSIPTTDDGTFLVSVTMPARIRIGPRVLVGSRPGGVVADRSIELLGRRATTTPAVPGYGMG